MSNEAIDLLQDFDLLQYPVDVVALSEKLNITIAEEDLEDQISGFLSIEDDNSTIVVNSNHHINRRRFTMAHELGHFILHKDQKSLFLDTKLKFYRSNLHDEHPAEIEIQANQFAADLLMPKVLIDELIDVYDLDLADEFDISKLSKKLKVSTQALTFRLIDLNFIFAF